MELLRGAFHYEMKFREHSNWDGKCPVLATMNLTFQFEQAISPDPPAHLNFNFVRL